MTHLQQPPRSSICGQTCVAMLADLSIEAAIAACTPRRRRVSSEHDLRRGLAEAGLRLGTFTRWSGPDRVPPAAAFGRRLMRVRFEGRRHGYHWVAAGSGFINDPAARMPVRPAVFERYLRSLRARVTSYAAVLPAFPSYDDLQDGAELVACATCLDWFYMTHPQRICQRCREQAARV